MSLYHRNIAILGAGPAALSAATRMRELGFNGCVYLVDDGLDESAIAYSKRDSQNFLWETHGFGIASHYAWVDRVCDLHMHNASLHINTCVHGAYGDDLHDVKKGYLSKAWRASLSDLNATWTLPDIAEPTGDRIIFAPGKQKDVSVKTRIARAGGMSTLWSGMANALPTGWLTHTRLVSIETDKRVLRAVRLEDETPVDVPYDYIISTMPLDALLRHLGASEIAMDLSKQMVGRVVVGVGLRGSPPTHLGSYHEVLFAQPEIPCHRAVLLSNISDCYVPVPQETWSARFEFSVASGDVVDMQHFIHTTVNLVTEQLAWASADDVISTFGTNIQYGLPKPYLQRDAMMEPLIDAIQTNFNILTRGSFGTWRGELAAADHDMMQAAEAVELLLNGVGEQVVRRPAEALGRRQTQLTSGHQTCHRSGALRFELVVARYQEDVAWLREYALQSIIYNKGGDRPPLDRYPRQQVLPNIGREAHTYLHHIVNNYHQLADTTLFCQGRLDDSVDYFVGLEDVIRRALNNPRDVATFRRYLIFDTWDQRLDHVGKWQNEIDSGIMRRAEMTPGQFWLYAFEQPPPPFIVWAWSATFAVRRAAILQRPRSFYMRLLKLFERINHVNPEEGHYMERIWLSIFGAPTGTETLAEYGVFLLNGPRTERYRPPPGARPIFLADPQTKVM